MDERNRQSEGLSDTFNRASSSVPNAKEDFNKASGKEYRLVPPPELRHDLVLKPGGILEQRVHTQEYHHQLVSPQLRDASDSRSSMIEQDRERANQPEAIKTKYETLDRNGHLWECFREPGMKDVYMLGDQDGHATVYLTASNSKFPMDYHIPNTLVYTKENDDTEWAKNGPYALDEAMDRGEAHVTQYQEKEQANIYQKRMEQRYQSRQHQNERGDKGRDR